VYEEDLEKEENKTTDHKAPPEETTRSAKYFAEDYSRSCAYHSILMQVSLLDPEMTTFFCFVQARARLSRDKKQINYIEQSYLSSDFLGRKVFNRQSFPFFFLSFFFPFSFLMFL